MMTQDDAIALARLADALPGDDWTLTDDRRAFRHAPASQDHRLSVHLQPGEVTFEPIDRLYYAPDGEDLVALFWMTGAEVFGARPVSDHGLHPPTMFGAGAEAVAMLIDECLNWTVRATCAEAGRLERVAARAMHAREDTRLHAGEVPT